MANENPVTAAKGAAKTTDEPEVVVVEKTEAQLAEEAAAAAEVARQAELAEIAKIKDGARVDVVAVNGDMHNLFTSENYGKSPVKTRMDDFVRGQLVAGKLARDLT